MNIPEKNIQQVFEVLKSYDSKISELGSEIQKAFNEPNKKSLLLSKRESYRDRKETTLDLLEALSKGTDRNLTREYFSWRSQ